MSSRHLSESDVRTMLDLGVDPSRIIERLVESASLARNWLHRHLCGARVIRQPSRHHVWDEPASPNLASIARVFQEAAKAGPGVWGKVRAERPPVLIRSRRRYRAEFDESKIELDEQENVSGVLALRGNVDDDWKDAFIGLGVTDAPWRLEGAALLFGPVPIAEFDVRIKRLRTQINAANESVEVERRELAVAERIRRGTDALALVSWR
jgi:hypothetical protein